MFRNIYIQAYKNSIQQNSTLQMMLIHANHIYAGLGCILQDIQFMVGNVLTHLKNNNISQPGNTKAVKQEGKQRISMPQKLEQITYKMPKYQFLPSSSLKYDNFQNYKPKFYEPPQKIRAPVKQQQAVKRNNSFEDMFPVDSKKARNSQNQDYANSKNNRISANPSPTPPKNALPESQEDFMDYLFKKKNKG